MNFAELMQVFQDIVLPINQLEKQIDVSDEIFDAYPILVYPCRIYDHGQHRGQLRPPRPDQMCPGTNWGNNKSSKPDLNKKKK